MFQIPILILIFLTGLIVGSFLNCLIYRLALPNFSLKNLGGLTGRSFCPHCKHVLAVKDLIPIFSFLALKGKCRYCQKPISRQYPLVELATGIIFLLVFLARCNEFTGVNSLHLWYFWVVSGFLIIIFVYDLKRYLIPDEIIYPAICIAFLYRLFGVLDLFARRSLGEGGGFDLAFRFWHLDFGVLANPLLSAILASSFFLSIFLISKGRWMGVGDIKLAFFMGLFLGWPNILVALFFAFFVGALIGIGLIISGKKTLKSEVPFGPFLVAGTFFASFLSPQMMAFYQRFFLLK